VNGAVVAAVCVGVGTALGSGRPGLALVCALSSLVAIASAVVFRRAFVVFACIALVFAAGASSAWRSGAAGDALAPKLAAKKAVVRACGTVDAIGPHSVQIRTERIVRRGRAWRVSEPLRVSGNDVEKLPVGERICAIGSLRSARAGRTEPPLLAADTIDRTGTGSRLRLWAGAVRKRYAEAAAHALPRKQAGLLLGMTDGDTDLIDPATTEDFRTTGLAHLVAVSGYNVAVYLAIVMVLVRFVVRRGRWVRVAIAIPALVFFAFLTGLQPSVLRATVSAGVALVVGADGRRADALRAASLAFAVLILLAPEMLFTIGFQLSFGATLGIILWGEALASKIAPRSESRFVRSASSGLGTTVAAQIAVAPLLAWHFGRIPGLGGFANIVAIPLGGLVMLGGMTTLTAASMFRFLDWAPATMRLPLDVILASAHAFARVPAASIAVSVVAACAITAALAAFAVRSTRVRAGCVALAVVGFGASSGQAIGGPSCPGAFVSALDIGQGTAVLMREGTHAVLFDSGPAAGGVVDQIRATGVGTLDAIFISHSHIDHALGALDVLRRMHVGHLFGPPELQWQAGAQVIREAGLHHVPFDALAAGDAFSAGNIHVEVLSPADRDLPTFTSDAIDANSLVLRVTVAGVRVLVPGDIRAVQQKMLESYEDVTAPILVAPHHGSKDLDPAFPDTVGERLTLITVGSPNPYGLPAPEAVAAYARRGPVFRTDQDGRVLVCVDKTGVQVVKQR
jgi:competence protein ComEC